MKKILKYDNLLLFIPLIILIIISLFNMINAALINDIYLNHFNKQLLWFIGGIITLFVIVFIPQKWIRKISPYLYYFNVLLLILVLFLGTSINGSKAWFKFSFFSLQPSELMKISLILYLSQLKKDKDYLYLLKVFIITFLPIVLVFLEPDTGAIIFYLIIGACYIYFKKINKWYKIIITILIGLLILLFGYLFFFASDLLANILGSSIYYRLDRLIYFKSGYQIENALVVIGSSRFFKPHLRDISLYIPEAPTDFIFSFTIGNFGYLIGFLVILLYFIIIYYMLKQTKNKANPLAIPLFFIISFQIIYNIGMNLNLLPIMGIPLPFLSYGGTNIIILFMLFGLLINFNMVDNNNYNRKSSRDKLDN